MIFRHDAGGLLTIERTKTLTSFASVQLQVASDFSLQAPGRFTGPGKSLSVLKSHFARACIGVYKQLYRLCERRFVRTFDLQKGFSLSEAANDGSGKEMIWVPKI